MLQIYINHESCLKSPFRKLDAGVMEAITKGPAFGDRKVLHAYVL
jgi:hypothetical protein